MNTNVVTIIGRLVRDVELKFTSNNKSYVNFSIAVNGYRDDETSFFDVVVWEKTAENVAAYTFKGQLLCVMGSLVQKHWKDRDGNKQNKIQINGRTVEFLSYPKEQQQQRNYGQQEEETPF